MMNDDDDDGGGDDDDDNDGIPDNREYILLPEEIQVDIWQLTVT